MSDCSVEEQSWGILNYVDGTYKEPIAEYFKTKEAAEKRAKELSEKWHKLVEAEDRSRRFVHLTDRQLLEIIAETLNVKV